jgi:hypothetical protein
MVVDAWIQRAIGDEPAIDAVAVFRIAFEHVWSCAATTLGSATLIAIAERVLHTAANRHRFLLAINPRPNPDQRWRQQLYDRLSAVPRAQLIEGLRFAMIELISVIGRLTAEILTDELHDAVLETTEGVPDVAIGPHALRSVGRERV